MRFFEHEPAYIVEYIAYLEHINDDNNLRVLFERVLRMRGSVTKKSMDDLWRRFLRFQLTMSQDGGQLDAVEDTEMRRGLPAVAGFETVSHRYSFRGLRPDSSDDVEYFKRVHSVNQDVSASRAPRAAASESERVIALPAFLQKIVTALPPLRRLKGPIPNVDILLAQLRDAPLPNRVHAVRVPLRAGFGRGFPAFESSALDLYQRRMISDELR